MASLSVVAEGSCSVWVCVHLVVAEAVRVTSVRRITHPVWVVGHRVRGYIATVVVTMVHDWVELVLDVATVLLFEHVVMGVLLAELLALCDLVLISRFTLHWQHGGWLVVLAVMEHLSDIRLHLQDEVALGNVDLGCSESG